MKRQVRFQLFAIVVAWTVMLIKNKKVLQILMTIIKKICKNDDDEK